MSNIEEKIWAYIDGTCSVEEKQDILLLIEQDENYRKVYDNLLEINRQLSLMELDEPSMAFTYNVLENIRTENAKQPLKTVIDNRIITGITAFFVVTIAALLVFALMNINWSENTTINYTLPQINLINQRVLKIFMFVDILLGAFLLDTFFRRKSSWKHI